jgi:hypothetical protein
VARSVVSFSERIRDLAGRPLLPASENPQGAVRREAGWTVVVVPERRSCELDDDRCNTQSFAVTLQAAVAVACSFSSRSGASLSAALNTARDERGSQPARLRGPTATKSEFKDAGLPLHAPSCREGTV